MRTDTAQHWISKTLESSFNTPEATGSNYAFLPTTDAFYQLPQIEKVNDAGRIGRNAASHTCSTYWSNPQYSIKDDIETGVPARLFARALGGSVTDSLVETGVYDHTFAILDPLVGSVLPSFSMASLLGAASFLFAGMMVERVKFSQKGSDRAVYEADVIGSGKFTNPHGLASLPALATTPCMDGFRTSATYVDDTAATIDLSSLGTLIEWMVEHKNNIRGTKRRVGDTIQTVSSTGTAAHVKAMPRGKYETQISMLLDFVDLTNWTKSVQGKTFTNLKFKAVGPAIGATSRHEFEIIVPSFTFETVAPGDDEGDAAIQVNVLPYQDGVTNGTITGRIRNATATLI
jgi:hypothetical protein